MLDANLLNQLKGLFDALAHPVVLRASLGADKVSKDMETLLGELASASERVTFEKVKDASLRRPSFQVTRQDNPVGIHFAGLPMGHEFTSLVLAILQTGGGDLKLDAAQQAQIKKLKGPMNFEVFMSLTCHNCPDVVQALNKMAVLNPNITVTTIEGSAFKEEAQSRQVFAVPTVFLNGELAFSGRRDLAAILQDLDQEGSDAAAAESLAEKAPFDILVVGAGPAGATAAVYAARKGLRTGILAQRMGGQVNETADIENLTGHPGMNGPQYAQDLERHIADYDIDVMVPFEVKRAEKVDGLWRVYVGENAFVSAKVVIAASGATWKTLGVPGEDELRGKGVAYCPHCDGPLFKGRNVAVIGGGNSGVEAAIDLAGICEHVTLVHRRHDMVADQCLQDKLKSLPNVSLLLNVLTTELEEENGQLKRLHYTDRDSGEAGHLDIAGCFVQIGLRPNTEWLKGTVELNAYGEVITDAHGRTSADGFFAAGDCTNSPYKQVVTALGEGATASLGAFDYLIRETASCTTK